MQDLVARLRGTWYRWRAKGRGDRVRIGAGLLAYVRLDIRGPGRVTIGENVLLGRVPGDNELFVTIYTHSPAAEVTIGDRARLFGARISSKFSVAVGPDALIEDAGITDTDFHSMAPDRGALPFEDLAHCAIRIGARVAIAGRSIVRKGVAIGDDAVVGPGAIVTRSVLPGVFVIGNPARAVSSAPGGRFTTDTAPERPTTASEAETDAGRPTTRRQAQ